MRNTAKYIIIVIAIIGVLVLLAILAYDKEAPGTLIAGLLTTWAAFRAKIFSGQSINVKDSILEVENEHAIKRQDWDSMKEKFDSQIDTLKAQIQYLEYKSAKVSEQLDDLDEEEVAAIKRIDSMSIEEKLRLLGQRYK